MDSTVNTGAPQPPKKRGFRKFLLITLLVFIVGSFAYVFICGLSYSDGTRSGILTKVSKKGFVFKTYEGEMNVGGISDGQGTIMPATIFVFSVRDKDVYKKLEEVQGKRVRVRYKQVMRSFFWQGETDYFVYEVVAIH
jgi:hypothetical protein